MGIPGSGCLRELRSRRSYALGTSRVQRWWSRSASHPSPHRAPCRSPAAAAPGRGPQTSSTSARHCPGTRAPRRVRRAAPATTPPSARSLPPGTDGRPSAGTRAGCSSASERLRASSSTSAYRPAAAEAAVPGCPCAPWRGTCRSPGSPAAAERWNPRAATAYAPAPRSASGRAAPGHRSASHPWSCCTGGWPWTWRRIRSRSTGTGPTPPAAPHARSTTREAGTCTGRARPRRLHVASSCRQRSVTVRFSRRIPADLPERVTDQAAADRRPLSSGVLHLLEAGVERGPAHLPREGLGPAHRFRRDREAPRLPSRPRTGASGRSVGVAAPAPSTGP